MPSSGTPARSKLCTQRALTVSRRELVSGAGRQDRELNQLVDVIGEDPGPLGDLLPQYPLTLPRIDAPV